MSKDTVAKYWSDSATNVYCQTVEGYAFRWDEDESMWIPLPLPPAVVPDKSWSSYTDAQLKLDLLRQHLTDHREKQYYCRTVHDVDLWQKTLETLFEEETK
jgi:hypothetical protein